jgi:hypothetical protein
MNGKDGADADVHVDIRRAVERIEHQHVFAVGIAVRDGDQVGMFFGDQGGQSTVVDRDSLNGLIGDQVNLHDLFALHVGLPGVSQDLDQAGARHLIGDDFASQGQVVQQAG